MKPSWRKPVGILALLVALALYAVLAVTLLAPVARWPMPCGACCSTVLPAPWQASLLPARQSGFMQKRSKKPQ